jgi:hypothetical protein
MGSGKGIMPGYGKFFQEWQSLALILGEKKATVTLSWTPFVTLMEKDYTLAKSTFCDTNGLRGTKTPLQCKMHEPPCVLSIKKYSEHGENQSTHKTLSVNPILFISY